MRNYNLTPLFRSTIGFDRSNRLFDTVNRLSQSDLAYPPYNIERLGEDRYRITMAVAGFSLDDFEVNQHDNVLVISGTAQPEPEGVTTLHRGIAGRAFERQFRARRARRGDRRHARRRSAYHRPRARRARSDEAQDHRDQGERRNRGRSTQGGLRPLRTRLDGTGARRGLRRPRI